MPEPLTLMFAPVMPTRVILSAPTPDWSMLRLPPSRLPPMSSCRPLTPMRKNGRRAG
jgi:hypothetical protein